LRETRQIFEKGLNERISRDRQTPDRLGKLQNARLSKRGQTLFASRMEGADEWHSVNEEDYVLVLDQSGVTGEHDVTTYKKGWLIRFEEVVDIGEFSPRIVTDIITEFVRVDELFFSKKRESPNFIEFLTVKEAFKLKAFPVIHLSDSLSVADFLTLPTRIPLTFIDSVEVVDRDLECLE
jgi:hypothetical protein